MHPSTSAVYAHPPPSQLSIPLPTRTIPLLTLSMLNFGGRVDSSVEVEVLVGMGGGVA